MSGTLGTSMLLLIGCVHAYTVPGFLSRRAASRPATMVIAEHTFIPEILEAHETELFREWFTTWGFAEPGPAPKKAPAKKAPAKKGKGKGKGKGKAPAKASGFSGGGGFGGAEAKPLMCKSPPEDLMTVVRANVPDGEAVSTEELGRWGAAARQTIEELLPRTGAVLLRGLPMRSPEEFSHFWKGCLDAQPALEEGRYLSLGGTSRNKMAGIDLATNVPPEFLLLCHNELCYNPQTIERIALYCGNSYPTCSPVCP